MAYHASAEPARPSGRVVVLDSLRGFALWGVLVVNTFIIARPPEGAVDDYGAVLPTDDAIAWLVRAFVSGKFYTLFAFLFGASFALQLGRLRQTGAAPAGWLRRRLVGLLAIGVLHSVLIWNGDILKLYAVLGLALLPLRSLSPGQLLKTSAALLGVFYVLYVAAAIGVVLLSAAPEVSSGAAEPAVGDVFRAGTYLNVTQERLRILLSPRQLAHLLAGLLYIFPLFMLGSWFAARELYRSTESSRRTVGRGLSWSGVLGLGSAAAFLYFGAVLGGARGTWAGAVKVITEQVTNLALGLFYLFGIVAHSHARPDSPLLTALAPMGRMALTNYLLHSVVTTWLMYGYGLGLADQMSATPLLLGASFLYLIQLGLSMLWLRLFRFGPAEWAWRSLTYGAMQPLRPPGAR